MLLFNKAAQKCWCFSLFKFSLEISLSAWASLNSALIISVDGTVASGMHRCTGCFE